MALDPGCHGGGRALQCLVLAAQVVVREVQRDGVGLGVVRDDALVDALARRGQGTVLGGDAVPSDNDQRGSGEQHDYRHIQPPEHEARHGTDSREYAADPHQAHVG